MSVNPVMVSICCVTYNHGKFIREAIDGFLMQRTSFACEIIIGDDHSTDNTREIINKYMKQYPGKIRLISSTINVGVHRNLTNVIKATTGTYIALCEGDDYWTDLLKLQKQVDFLEKHNDYVICCHYTRVIDETRRTLYVDPAPVPLKHSYLDLLCGKQQETKTATMVYRNTPEANNIYSQPWFFNCFAGDKIFKLSATQNTGGLIYVMPEVMSCYRNHNGGIWSMIDAKVRTKMSISDFNLIIRRFSYPASQKRKLLMLYLSRYFLFEIMNSNFGKAFQTIKYLL